MRLVFLIASLLALAVPCRAEQSIHVHGNGVTLTITILPPIPGLPLMGAAVGTVDGRPVGGVGYLRILPGDFWILGCMLSYMPPPDDGDENGKQDQDKPKDKNPHPKPWVLDLGAKKGNEDRPGDQDAGTASNPDGTERKLSN